MRRFLKKIGWLASVLAVFVSGGGHWMALQSVAWGRMFVDYSRTDSLATAVEKTFDGDHPCPMCKKISADRAQERREQPQSPAAAPARLLADLMSLPTGATIPAVPFHLAFARAAASPAPALFMDAPPTPPPRPAARLA